MQNELTPKPQQQINRPESHLGGFDWEKLPDGVFWHAEELRRDIQENPRMSEIFQLFIPIRVVSDRLLMAYGVLIDSQRQEGWEAKRIHPDLEYLAQLKEIIEAALQKIGIWNNEMRIARQHLQEMFDKDEQAALLYQQIEGRFDGVVSSAMPALTDPTPQNVLLQLHTSDREPFDRMMYELLQSSESLVK